MRARALELALCAASALSCGDSVKLGEDPLLSLQPRQIQLESPPALALTARSPREDELIRVPLACADDQTAACPGYESRLWVDAAGVWLANVAEDRRTVQLAHLSPDGELLASARWMEPDPFRTVREPALWRAEHGELRLALLQEGCDLTQASEATFCVVSGERVRVLAVSDALTATLHATFVLEPGFRTTRVASSAAGALLVSEIEHGQPVDGNRHHTRVQRLSSDGAMEPARMLRDDYSYPYSGRAAGIDEQGRIGLVLDKNFKHVYGLDADGNRTEDAVIQGDERLLDTALPADGHLVLVFTLRTELELVDLEGESYQSTPIAIELAQMSDLTSLYLRHARIAPGDGVELLYHHSPPEGALFCRIARRAREGTCLALGSPGELWDLHSSRFGTWIATGSSLIGVRSSLAGP